MGYEELALRLARGHVDCVDARTLAKKIKEAAARAWDEGRTSASRGLKNNPYTEEGA